MDIELTNTDEFIAKLKKLDESTTAECEKALKKTGMKIVSEAQKNIRKAPNTNTTGALSNSGKVVKKGELSYDAGFGINYAEYVEEGRRPGRMPPVKQMAEWAKKKLRVPDKDKMGVGFVIARKIARQGTKGKHFFSAALDTCKKYMEEQIEKALNKAENDV